MLEFVEKHKFGIIGTVLFHFIMLFVFYKAPIYSGSYDDKDFQQEVQVEFIQEEIPLEQQEPTESTEDDASEEVRNVTSNSNDTRKKSFENYSNWNKNAVDKNVEQSVHELEKQFLEERKAAGKSFDPSKYEVQSAETKKMDKDDSKTTSGSANAENQYAGKVTASCSVPGRDCSNIKKPSYVCRGSGKVILNIEVNQKGVVTKAEVDESRTNTRESCLLEQSKNYALKSRFDQDFNAPKSVEGTIEYNFIAQ